MLKIAYNQNYIYPLEENHRFPMIKYELIPEQLIRENTCTENNFFNPEKVDDYIVLLTHQKEYFERFKSLDLSKREIREIGFPLSKELVDRELQIADGTIKGVHYSIKHGISMNIAGGTHHAFYDRGEAFCMLNDQAIAANFLLKKKLVERIMIVDLDVHQGDGTASIFSNESRVFTLSFHGKKNYPFKKQISDFDCEFDDGTNDTLYLNKLKNVLPDLIKRFSPQFVFYLAGVDVLENDKLGRLSLSMKGCKERDAFVMNCCKKNGIPLQISMGGGYSSNISDIVQAHCNTFHLAKEIFFPN